MKATSGKVVENELLLFPSSLIPCHISSSSDNLLFYRRRCQHYLGIFWFLTHPPACCSTSLGANSPGRRLLISSSYRLCHYFMFLPVSLLVSLASTFKIAPPWNFQFLVATSMWFRPTLTKLTESGAIFSTTFIAHYLPYML